MGGHTGLSGRGGRGVGQLGAVIQGFQPVLVDQEQACPHCDLVGDVSVVNLSVLSLSKQSLVLPGGGGGYSGR